MIELSTRTLSQALEDHDPACRDDAAFTADEVTPAGDERLASVCGRCPIRVECAADARAERPRWGFWAGRRYGPTTTPAERPKKAPRDRTPPPPPEPPRPILVGDEFEDIRNGARIVVTTIDAQGDAVFIRYEFTRAGAGATKGFEVGDFQWGIANVLGNVERFRRLARTT